MAAHDVIGCVRSCDPHLFTNYRDGVVFLDRVPAGLARSNSDGVFNIADEDFAVTDPPRPCRLLNGLDGPLQLILRQDDFNL